MGLSGAKRHYAQRTGLKMPKIQIVIPLTARH